MDAEMRDKLLANGLYPFTLSSGHEFYFKDVKGKIIGHTDKSKYYGQVHTTKDADTSGE